jgi:hypothetical protein
MMEAEIDKIDSDNRFESKESKEIREMLFNFRFYSNGTLAFHL